MGLGFLIWLFLGRIGVWEERVIGGGEGDWGRREFGEVMYGSPVSKDLNLPVQPLMSSSRLLRYRLAPNTLLGEVCEDFL